MANLTLIDEMKGYLTIEEWRVKEKSIEVDHFYPNQDSCDTTVVNHDDFSAWLEELGRFACPFIYNEGMSNERIVECTQTYEQYLDGTCRHDIEADLKEYLFTNKKAA